MALLYASFLELRWGPTDMMERNGKRHDDDIVIEIFGTRTINTSSSAILLYTKNWVVNNVRLFYCCRCCSVEFFWYKTMGRKNHLLRERDDMKPAGYCRLCLHKCLCRRSEQMPIMCSLFFFYCVCNFRSSFFNDLH